MLTLRMAAVITFCLGSTGLAAATEPTTIQLEPKAYRSFDFVLPAERFAEVGSGFAVPHAGGDRFAAATEGERLRADLDGDGALEALVEGEVGFLTFARQGADGRSLAYSVRLVRSTGAPWTYSCGGAMIGTFGDTRIQVLDQNLNGRFDDFGADALVVGKSNVASFLSRVVSIDGALFALDVAADGASITLAPYQGETGVLDLCSGFASKAKLNAAIVTSADGTTSFDLARAKQGLRVPAGTYLLRSGQLVLGDAHAKFGQGRAAPLNVAAGSTNVVAWGGPATAEFVAQRGVDAVGFSPADIWVYGRLGEEYVDFMPLGKSPEFTIKDKATGEVLASVTFPGHCCSAGFKAVAATVPVGRDLEITMAADNWAFGDVTGKPRAAAPTLRPAGAEMPESQD